MALARHSTPHIVSRVAASLLGGYAFTWGFASLGITAQLGVGVDYEDAYITVMLLAFLVFLAVFCWAIAAPRLSKVWAVLLGGGGAMTATAWWLTRSLA